MFTLADGLVIETYRRTRQFPAEERWGLQAQLRRAVVSTAANIVEGCARRSTGDYVRFLNMAFASACEARYLLGLSLRLHFVSESDYFVLDPAFDRALQKLVVSLVGKP